MSRCVFMLLTRGGSLWVMVLLAALAGCSSSPRAEFLQVSCDRVERGGELQAVSFGSAIEVHGLAGQQVVYRVSVVDSRLRPLKSADKRFRDAAGNVAASKALMVHESPWTLTDARVTIPVTELEIRRRDLPVLAEFSVCLASGECLDRQTVVLPVYGTTEGKRAAPPAAASGRASQRPVTKRAAAGSKKSADGTGVASRTPTTQRSQPPPDWWHAAAADTSSLATEAMRALSPFGLVFGVGDEGGAGEVATSRPAPQPAAKRPAPKPTTTAPVRGIPQAKSDAKAASKHRVYVVRRGDSLWNIAERLLGDGNRWRDILELNRDKLASPDALVVGDELRLPARRAARPGKRDGR